MWDTVRRTRSDRPDAPAAALKSVLDDGFTGPATALPHDWDTGLPLTGEDDASVVALSPDGTHLAIGGPLGDVIVRDGHGTRYRSAVIPGASAADCVPCSRVTALTFSPDSRTLAVGYASGPSGSGTSPTGRRSAAA